ncbi:DUF6387 family protein [Vibrio diazotrophicus]|uniref:DUF6387 family protein n=1 Tax=Vibrio diazotrophicus TaxID=685 RepID=UPI00142E3B41|nr:DUF6387 family protein [Vibrio diazotrophicus]NIY92579.1 hypothetical protein [Vibrio diazotrophicus]
MITPKTKSHIQVNKTKAKKKYIPQWFCISNYDVLKNISVDQYLRELQLRLDTLQCVKAFLPNNLASFEEYSCLKIRGYDREDVVEPEKYDWKKIRKKVSVLSHPQSGFEAEFVTVVKNSDLSLLSGIAELMKKEHYRKPPSLQITNSLPTIDQLKSHDSELDSFWNRESYLSPFHKDKKQILLSIDLENTDNSIVLAQIKSLIDGMREKLQIPEKELIISNNASIQTLKKFLDYKAIPYLDLLIYAYSHDYLETQPLPLKFSSSVLCDLLFSDRDFKSVSSTIQDFYDKQLLNDEFMTKFISNISEEKVFMKIKMLDIKNHKKNQISNCF